MLMLNLLMLSFWVAIAQIHSLSTFFSLERDFPDMYGDQLLLNPKYSLWIGKAKGGVLFLTLER